MLAIADRELQNTGTSTAEPALRFAHLGITQP